MNRLIHFYQQGFFLNRFGALENYLQYANIILAQFPILELRNPTFLYNSGDTFDTTQYWTAINWWAAGYNDNTKSSLQVPLYADLATLNVPTGTMEGPTVPAGHWVQKVCCDAE